MAAVHAGLLEAQCTVCQDDPSLQDYWGCEEPTQAPVWVMGEEEFHNCPLKFISGHAVDWHSEYCYVAEFGGIRYDEVPNRWYEAWQTYRAALSEASQARAELEKQRKEKHKVRR